MSPKVTTVPVQPTPPPISHFIARGIETIDFHCTRCHHSAKVAIGTFEPYETVLALQARALCTKCNSRDIDVRPGPNPNRPKVR